MLVFQAFGYTFRIDAAGVITSGDADAATLRTVVRVAEDNLMLTPLPEPHRSYGGILLHYGPERVQLVEAPALDTSAITGEVIY